MVYAVFRIRSVAAFAIHKFFNERNFVYVNTPIITANDCEGAGEMFHVTTLDNFFSQISFMLALQINSPLHWKNKFFVRFLQNFNCFCVIKAYWLWAWL